MREAAWRWWRDGATKGRAEGERWAAQTIERLTKEVEKLEKKAAKKLDKKMRRYGEPGAQLVQCGNYAYRWTGSPPLEVGDKVVLPGNWLYPNEQIDEVTQLGSTYTGAHSDIVSRA